AQYELFSPDSRQLAAGHRDGTISVYDLETGRLARSLPLGVHCKTYAFRPDGRQLAVAFASKVQVWDLKSGQVVREIPSEVMGGIVHLAWDPDGKILATANNSGVHAWNVSSGTQLHELAFLHMGGGTMVAFDPSGEILYSGSFYGGTCRLWHVRS